VIILNISAHLVNKIKSIPTKPGVYMMKDYHGNIIYIGKSKCLNKRVKSYFQTKHNWEKINRLVFNIHDIDFVVTDTHLEAQLLECELIKKYKPIYNSQFAKDKNYVYLKVEECMAANPLSMTIEKDGKNIFGPFRSKRAINDLTNSMLKLYPIKKHENNYEFEYNSLPNIMNQKEFEENKTCLIEIFSKEKQMEIFMNLLEEKMKEASSCFRFERASYFRDILLLTKYIYNSQKDNILKDNRILMGEKFDEGYKLFYIYNGNIIMKKKFSNLSIYDVDEFVYQSKNLEAHFIVNQDEKSNLDFKDIINIELKDKTTKVVEIIDANFDVRNFLNGLIKL